GRSSRNVTRLPPEANSSSAASLWKDLVSGAAGRAVPITRLRGWRWGRSASLASSWTLALVKNRHRKDRGKDGVGSGQCRTDLEVCCDAHEDVGLVSSESSGVD